MIKNRALKVEIVQSCERRRERKQKRGKERKKIEVEIMLTCIHEANRWR